MGSPMSALPPCVMPRCKTPMKEVLRIAPLGGEPGLIGYARVACCSISAVRVSQDANRQYQ